SPMDRLVILKSGKSRKCVRSDLLDGNYGDGDQRQQSQQESHGSGLFRTAGLLCFLQMVGLLKRVPRTGWLYRNLENPESVSDLIYQMAVMAMGDQTQPSQQELSEELLSHESLLC
ncbi:hypothetical protein STEG23_026003, partial [Scotinomys teguina]